MTTHTAITDYYAGADLDDGSLLCHRTTDATVKTASATGELNSGGGVYSAVFSDVAAGSYRLKLLSGGEVVATRDVTFAGTNNETVQTGVRAELDSSSVTAVQSGLALEATSQSIKTKTDNLPSDPADQSLIVAATDAVMARLGAPAGVSMSADIAAVKTETASLLSRLTANAATAIQNLYHMITGTGASSQYTTDALENAPTGEGGVTTVVTLQSVASISPGVIVGPSEPLVIGDDYLTAMNRSIRINLLDADGDPAEVEFGSYALDDSGISIQLLLARSGKPSTTADVVGTCTFFPAVGEIPPYLIVEFTKVETAKAVPGAYDMQAEAVWNDGKVITFAPYGQIQFVRNIGRQS